MQVLLIALNYIIVGYNESSNKTGARLTVKKLGEATPKAINTTMNIYSSTTKPTGNIKIMPMDTIYHGDVTKPPNTNHHHRIMMDPSLQVKKEMMIDPVDGNGYNESSNKTRARLTVKKLGEATPKAINTTMNIDSSTTKTTGIMIDPVQQKNNTAGDHNMKLPVYRGECCSQYGMKFIECITSTFNVNTIAIQDITHECHVFEGKNLETMTNKEKRFILYW